MNCSSAKVVVSQLYGSALLGCTVSLPAFQLLQLIAFSTSVSSKWQILDFLPLRSCQGCVLVCRSLRLPEEVEEILKIFVMVPKQLSAEVVSELEPEPAQNTLDAGDRAFHTLRHVNLLNVAHWLDVAAGATGIGLEQSSFPSTVSGCAS